MSKKVNFRFAIPIWVTLSIWSPSPGKAQLLPDKNKAADEVPATESTLTTNDEAGATAAIPPVVDTTPAVEVTPAVEAKSTTAGAAPAASASPMAGTTTTTEPPPPPPADIKTATDTKPMPSKKNDQLILASEDGRFSVSPILLLQPLFRIPIDPEADYTAANSGVMLKRARLGLDATFFSIASVRLQGDFRNGAPELVDAYADIDPLKGQLVVRFGWFRPLFGRQRLSSASKQQFVEFAQAWNDRSLGLNLNRDMGLSLFGMAAGALEWGVGLFNGEKSFSPDANRDFAVNGRLAFHPLAAAKVGGEELPYSDETALKMRNKPALSIGSAVYFDARNGRTLEVEDAEEPLTYGDRQIKLGGELGFQWLRLSFTSEVFWLKTLLNADVSDEVIAAVDALTPTAATRGNGLGTYAQVSVLAVKDLLELALRFDWVDEQIDTSGSRFYPAFGVNLYIKGHNLKLQGLFRTDIAAGYEESHPAAREQPSFLVELMLQTGF